MRKRFFSSLASVLVDRLHRGSELSATLRCHAANFRAPDPLPPGQAASFADLKWFEVFKDEKLQELIRTHWSRTTTCATPSPASKRLGQPRNHAIGPVSEIRRRRRRGDQSPVARRSNAAAAAVPTLAESQFRNRRAAIAVFRNRYLGQAAARHGGRARQSPERRGKSQSRGDDSGQRRGHRLLDTARTRLRARNLAARLSRPVRSRSTLPDRGKAAASRRCSTCARRNNWCTPPRKPSPDPAADRADRESDQPPARGKPGSRARADEPHRTAASPGGSRRAAIGTARTPSRYPGGRAGPDRRERGDRRGASRLFPEVESQRRSGRREHATVESVQRPASLWSLTHRSPSRSSPPGGSNQRQTRARPSTSTR